MPSDLASSSPTPEPSRFAGLLPSDPTITMLGALIAGAVIIFGALTPSRFLSGDTLRAIAFQMPELGILSLAMMMFSRSTNCPSAGSTGLRRRCELHRRQQQRLRYKEWREIRLRSVRRGDPNQLHDLYLGQFVCVYHSMG